MAENNIICGEAYLWNGNSQLPGQLCLKKDRISFHLTGFEESNLKLEIEISDLLEVEEFLLFDVALNGLLIKSRSGREDHFILENPISFRKTIQNLQQEQNQNRSPA